MKNAVSSVLLTALCLILSFSLFSCGTRYEDEEIAAAAKQLIEDSGRINDIYFGDGLPLASAEEYYGMFDPDSADNDNLGYYPVAGDCGFGSTEDIKEATLLVYTEEYSDVLFTNAFEGFSVTVGEGDLAERQAVSLARYIDSDYGFLAARKIAESEKLPLGRVYDTDNITVVSQRGGRATVSVPSVSPGGEKETVELTVKMTSAGWRLDTPTY